MGPIIHSEISSVASTPCSNKSGSALSKKNMSGLKKLKQKLKSAKKEKKIKQSCDSARFRTPATKKQISLIQTPRHSLKKVAANNSRGSTTKSSRASSIASTP